MWWVASEDTVLLGLPAKQFVACLESNTRFYEALAQLRSVHELNEVLQQAAASDARLAAGWQQQLQAIGNTDQSWTASVEPGEAFAPPDGVPSEVVWLLSTAEVPGMTVGQVVQRCRASIRPGFSCLIADWCKLDGLTSNWHPNVSVQMMRGPFERPGQSLERLGSSRATRSAEGTFPWVAARTTRRHCCL